jgi:hypothetical protein
MRLVPDMAGERPAISAVGLGPVSALNELGGHPAHLPARGCRLELGLGSPWFHRYWLRTGGVMDASVTVCRCARRPGSGWPWLPWRWRCAGTGELVDLDFVDGALAVLGDVEGVLQQLSGEDVRVPLRSDSVVFLVAYRRRVQVRNKASQSLRSALALVRVPGMEAAPHPACRRLPATSPAGWQLWQMSATP